MKTKAALKQLRATKPNELIKSLDARSQELRKAYSQVSLGKEKNIRSIRALRQQIARIWTILRERHDETT